MDFLQHCSSKGYPHRIFVSEDRPSPPPPPPGRAAPPLQPHPTPNEWTVTGNIHCLPKNAKCCRYFSQSILRLKSVEKGKKKYKGWKWKRKCPFLTRENTYGGPALGCWLAQNLFASVAAKKIEPHAVQTEITWLKGDNPVRERFHHCEGHSNANVTPQQMPTKASQARPGRSWANKGAVELLME